MVVKHSLRGSLVARALVRLLGGMLVIGGLLFLPAGTFDFWQAWLFLVAMFVPMLAVGVYLFVHDPALLERRLRAREPQRTQRVLIALGSVLYLLAFGLPGFDRRFGWSDVPTVVVLLADVGFVAGYLLFAWVLRVNSFASRVVQVEADQTVVTTGPYAAVRHPMYSALLVMLLAAPLALGSWWALLPSLAVVGVLAARIRNEESVLTVELPGYREYVARRRFRLVPGLW
jgi:protein-S-isoprenylcysteine O-methyltransferase Ste14